MDQNPSQDFEPERGYHRLYNVGDFLALVSGAKDLDGILKSIVTGTKLSGLFFVFRLPNLNGVGQEDWERVDLHAKFDFDQLTFLELLVVFLERREVAAERGGTDADWEGNSFGNFLFVINLVGLL